MEYRRAPGQKRTNCPHHAATTQKASPPRIRAAVLRTIFNGWTTSRRLQTYNRCLFSCADWTHEDSIEHYASCPFTHDVRKRRLNLRISPWHKSCFFALLLPQDSDNDTNLTKCALLIHAIYRAHNYVLRRTLAKNPNSSP